MWISLFGDVVTREREFDVKMAVYVFLARLINQLSQMEPFRWTRAADGIKYA